FRKPEDVDWQNFLNVIDFYLYYPDRSYVGRCASVLLHAMRAGLPVLTYPEMRDICGSAASYAVSERVSSVAEAYWRDTEKYVEASKKSTKYAIDNCLLSSLKFRLSEEQ